MLAITNIVLPIFALIIAGYILRRTDILSSNACTELNRFVVWLALPALMIDIMLNTDWKELYQPAFLLVFELGVFVIFFGVLIVHWLKTKNLAAAAIDATSASYANNGYIGIPLATLTFGAANLAPTLVSCLMTISANFIVSIIFLEIASQTGKSLLTTLKQVFVSLCKNPLIISPVIAGIICATGWEVPAGAVRAVHLLGAAASPCALVATGLFLAQPRKGAKIIVPLELTFLKLVAQPLIVWYLAYYVFPMPPLWARSVVILSALPTGTGPFMLAELYGKGGGVASRTIFLSTLIGIVTVSLCLTYL